MEVKKRANESTSSLIYRFSRRAQQSGIIKEARKRRFRKKAVSRREVRLSAIHRDAKRKEHERARKLGITSK